MPRLVLILPSTTYRAKDFLDAADSLDVELLIASDQPPPIDMGDRYIAIDHSDSRVAAEQIATLGEKIPIDGVVAADDRGVLVAAHASSLMGLSGNPPGAAELTRNKLSMRKSLAKAEVSQPRYMALQPGESADAVGSEVGFPLVVKPVDRSASQGVIRVDRLEDMSATVDRVRAIVGEEATLLVESFAAGSEVALEGLIEKGELLTLAVFDKPDTSDGPVFPETIFVTPSRLDEESLALVKREASNAVRALGLRQGPCHIELRIDDGRAQIIEIAARSIGGLCSRSLNFGLMGTTLESLILRNALDVARTQLKQGPGASGVLMIPTPKSGTLKRVEGLDSVRDLEGITGVDVTIPIGGRVLAPPEGDRYLGFVYARAETPEAVETALRNAQSNIEVQLEG